MERLPSVNLGGRPACCEAFRDVLQAAAMPRAAARLGALPTEEPVPRCAVRDEPAPRCAAQDVEERRCEAPGAEPRFEAWGAEPRSEAWGAEPQCAALGEARPSSEAVLQVAARAVQVFCSPVKMLRLWPARAKQV